jgi:antitoxin component YwqK of YwqJK toxin-antitoxin module
MASIDQYLEVINDRFQEENKQGINRADTEQYLQEMSLKYFREYEVEFEKVKEEDKKNLALERVKGFYECLIQIASDDKFDSQFEKTCWSSFIAAHMTMGQCDVWSFEYKSLFIQQKENDTVAEDFEQLKLALPFLLPIARYYSPVLNFAYRGWLNDLSASDALNFLELMDELPSSYWPENLLWYKVLTLMKYGYGEKALEALKFYETLPKNKLRWYYINNIQHRDKYDEMIMDEIDEMTFDKSRIKILYKLNRYSEAQKYIEDYFVKYGQRIQEKEAEWSDLEKNIENSSDRSEIMRYEIQERVRFINQNDQYSIENIRDNIGEYLLPKSQFKDSDLDLIKGLDNERILLLDDQVPDMPGMLNGEMDHAYFADIDGSWYYPSGCSTGKYKIIFKAFSRDKFDNKLKSILTSNGLLDSFISTNGQDQLNHIAEEGGQWSKGYIKVEVPRHTSQFGRLIRIFLDKRFLDRGESDLYLQEAEDEQSLATKENEYFKNGLPFNGLIYRDFPDALTKCIDGRAVAEYDFTRNGEVNSYKAYTYRNNNEKLISESWRINSEGDKHIEVETKNGKIISYDENGIIESENNLSSITYFFKDGKKQKVEDDDEIITYFKDGTISSRHMKNTKYEELFGKYEYYKVQDFNYFNSRQLKDDIHHPYCTIRFREDGSVKCEFKNDELYGAYYVAYYENGAQKLITINQENFRFDKDGIEIPLLDSENFDTDLIIKRKELRKHLGIPKFNRKNGSKLYFNTQLGKLDIAKISDSNKTGYVNVIIIRCSYTSFAEDNGFGLKIAEFFVDDEFKYIARKDLWRYRSEDIYWEIEDKRNFHEELYLSLDEMHKFIEEKFSILDSQLLEIPHSKPILLGEKKTFRYANLTFQYDFHLIDQLVEEDESLWCEEYFGNSSDLYVLDDIYLDPERIEVYYENWDLINHLFPGKYELKDGVYEEISNLELRVNFDDNDEIEDIGIVTHYKGMPFTGVGYSLNVNGSISIEVEFVNGLKHGAYKIYDLDGNILGEIRYADDEFADESQEKEYFNLLYKQLSPIIESEGGHEKQQLIRVKLLIQCRRYQKAREKLEIYHSIYPRSEESKELENQILD